MSLAIEVMKLELSRSTQSAAVPAAEKAIIANTVSVSSTPRLGPRMFAKKLNFMQSPSLFLLDLQIFAEKVLHKVGKQIYRLVVRLARMARRNC